MITATIDLAGFDRDAAATPCRFDPRTEELMSDASELDKHRLHVSLLGFNGSIYAMLGVALLASLMGGCGSGRIQDSVLDPNPDSAGPRDPVIFVHGCPPPPPICVSSAGEVCTNEEESNLWLPLADDFKARGYPDSRLHRFVAAGPACTSTITQSRQLAQLVEDVRAATGASKVDIVAHSMGALTTRLYLLEASDRVDDFVSLGGGNHGSQLTAAAVEWQEKFGAPAYEGAKEMFPPYACKGQTVQAADVQFEVNGCLTITGRTVERDETPGSVHYLSIRNSVDEIVDPREASCLNQRFQDDCSDTVNVEVTVPPGPGPCGPDGCPGHVVMLWDAGVIEKVYQFVACEGDDRCLDHSG